MNLLRTQAPVAKDEGSRPLRCGRWPAGEKRRKRVDAGPVLECSGLQGGFITRAEFPKQQHTMQAGRHADELRTSWQMCFDRVHQCPAPPFVLAPHTSDMTLV